MSWFTPRAPVDEGERQWIEDSMLRLVNLFGMERLRGHPTILPTKEFFPEKITPNEAGLDAVVKKVCGFMDVNIDSIDVYLYSEQDDSFKKHLSQWSDSSSGAAGRYVKGKDERQFVGIEMKLLKEPVKLVATIAHELGHVLLLGGGKVRRDEEDHEYLTDLLTVYMGLGIFTANSRFQFSQWQGAGNHGWSSSSIGYLSQSMYGYSLAAYCWMRGELNPEWQKILSTNVRDAFAKSMKFLVKTGSTQLPRG